MDNPVRDIQGYTSVFQRAMFYPGDELNFTFANDSILDTWWWALYHELTPTGPLTTAVDFYNYFVLGYLSANYQPGQTWWSDDYALEETSADNSTANITTPDYGCSNGDPQLPNWYLTSMGPYPNDPVVAQRDLDIHQAGVVTGYILEDISTGVLSVPSFYQTGHDTQYFAEAVDVFVNTTRARNTSRITIDLQQNNGGMVLLALNMFKQFFYRLQPYTGNRIRSHELANLLGSAYTQWWGSLESGEDGANDPRYQLFVGSEWVVTNRINPVTGRNFTSWSEYCGQVSVLGDSFSQQVRTLPAFMAFVQN